MVQLNLNGKESILYCHKYKTSKYNKDFGDYWYTHFYSHPEVTKECNLEKDVYKVKVREIKEGEKSIYWAWWENKDNAFVFVNPTREILSVNFPYSIESYVERGDGKDYNVIIEELEIINKEEIKW